MNKFTILVVCSGNMFRSPVAAFCLKRALLNKKLNNLIEVTSRGIQGLGSTTPPQGKNLMDYPREWRYSQPEFIRFGIDISNHYSTLVTEDIIAKAVLVLAMDWGILYSRPNSLTRLSPSYTWKMRLFSELDGQFKNIEDIFGQDEAAPYSRAIQLIDSIAQRGICILPPKIQTAW